MDVVLPGSVCYRMAARHPKRCDDSQYDHVPSRPFAPGSRAAGRTAEAARRLPVLRGGAAPSGSARDARVDVAGEGEGCSLLSPFAAASPARQLRRRGRAPLANRRGQAAAFAPAPAALRRSRVAVSLARLARRTPQARLSLVKRDAPRSRFDGIRLMNAAVLVPARQSVAGVNSAEPSTERATPRSGNLLPPAEPDGAR